MDESTEFPKVVVMFEAFLGLHVAVLAPSPKHGVLSLKLKLALSLE